MVSDFKDNILKSSSSPSHPLLAIKSRGWGYSAGSSWLSFRSSIQPLAAHSLDLSAKIVTGWTIDTAEFRWGVLGLISFSESKPCDQHGVKGFAELGMRSISSTMT